MDIKILNEIGQGLMGAVYKSTLNGVECATKLQLAELCDNTYSHQVEFDEYVRRSNYTAHFLTLVGHGWTSSQYPSCGDTISVSMQHATSYVLCYTPVLDITLAQVLERSDTFEHHFAVMTDVVSQLIPVLRDMKMHGFSHGDVHDANIMLGGGRWYIIDYGEVRHTTWPSAIDHSTSDAEYLADMTVYSPIRNMMAECTSFKLRNCVEFDRIIKSAAEFKDIDNMTKHILDRSRDDIARHCEVNYFELFRKAVGVPPELVIEPSRLLIPSIMARDLDNIRAEPQQNTRK